MIWQVATMPQGLESGSYLVDTFLLTVILIDGCLMTVRTYSYLELHLDSINVQDFILEMKARNHKWQYLNLKPFFQLVVTFMVYERNNFRCETPVWTLFLSSTNHTCFFSFHQYRKSPPHFGLFWWSLASFLLRINPSCPPRLPSSLHLKETFLWSQLRSVPPHNNTAQPNRHAVSQVRGRLCLDG